MHTAAEASASATWPKHGHIRLYHGLFDLPCKTGSLSPVSLHIGGSMAIPIPSELRYIDFPRNLSAQDPEQLRQGIEECDVLISCLTEQLGQLLQGSAYIPQRSGPMSLLAIPSGLHYMDLPENLSKQDPTEIRLAIVDLKAVRSCLKKQLDMIIDSPIIRWMTGRL